MHELLNFEMIDIWHLEFQKKIQADLLDKFILAKDFRSLLLDIDFNKTTFAPDLFCLYFTAKLNNNLNLNASSGELFLDANQNVSINVIDPIASPADYYFANLPEINNSSLGFAIPFIGSNELQATTAKLQSALKLLHPIALSCVNSNLLNSIAIFLGKEELSTAATIMLSQGRVYIKYMGDEYPGLYYLDMIIHELSHLYFNLINYLYPMISDHSKMIFSVVKKVNRPIYAIYHTTFVLYRLLCVYEAAESLLKEHEQPIKPSDTYNDYLYSRFFQIPFNFEFRRELYRQKFAICFDQLLNSNALTPIGKSLLMAMKPA